MIAFAMLSSTQQRLLIAASIGLGGLVWIGILPTLKAPDGSTGLSLFTASCGPWLAMALILIGGLPAVALGALCASTGRFVHGLFVYGGTLTLLALKSGSSAGWLETAHLPNDYLVLAFEMLIWQIGLLLAIQIISQLRSLAAQRLPELLTNENLWQPRLAKPNHIEIKAGFTATAIAFLACFVCLQTTDTVQILGALVLAFALGAAIAQTIFPQNNPIGILFSPALVAILGYGLVLLRFDGPGPLIQAWFSRTQNGVSLWQHFPGPALALPIHYASAGLVGCSLGIGIAKSIAYIPTPGHTPSNTPAKASDSP